MTLVQDRLAAATAVAAAFSLAATPVAAVELPRRADAPQAWDADAMNAANRRHHRDWDDDDIDGDDILTGVLILGGLAAIAGIANSAKNRQQPYPERAPVPDDAEYQPPAREDRSGGMAAAVDVCVDEVEAGRGEVGSVDRASRSGEGWYVAGELDGGAPFACWIDGAGRVTDIEAADERATYETPAANDASYPTVQKEAVGGEADDEQRYALARAAD